MNAAKIQHVRYDEEFRLSYDCDQPIYSLVNTGEREVKRSRGLAVKNRQGDRSTLPWDTVVYVLEKR